MSIGKLPDRFVFGVRLKELMKKSGVNQTELANMLGFDRSRLSHYINGRYEPDIAVLAAISSIMKTSIDYLIGMTDTMSLAGLKNPEKNFSSIIWQKERPKSESDKVLWIPVYETRSAEVIQEAEDDPAEPIGWVRGWSKTSTSSNWDYHYMLVASDDSMSPYIIKGDLLCVEQLEIDDINHYQFRSGAVYIVKQSEYEEIGLTMKSCCLTKESIILSTIAKGTDTIGYDIKSLKFKPIVGIVSTILRRPLN